MDIIYFDPISSFPANLPSNKIFGAICIGIKELYGDDELSLMLEQFQEDKVPFILSSAFPFIYNEEKKERHHFFPKPIVKPAMFVNYEKYYDAIKNYKKVKYLDQVLFNRFINGKTDENSLIMDIDNNKVRIIKKNILIESYIDNDFVIRKQDIPHNILNRLSNASENFYYTTGTNYKNSGLFFLIKIFNNTYRSKINASLRFIEDRGFGGDISTGMGQFKLSVAIDKELINEPQENSRYSIMLSLYSPEHFNSFDKEKCWYELMRIRGRCGDGFMKKGIWAFKEGSTFSIHDQEKHGKVIYVRKNPDVVEYGIAYPIRMVGK